MEQAQALFVATRILSYRVFFFTLYSLGDRASAHRTPGTHGWHGGAARCCTRGGHALSTEHRSPLAANMPMGMVVALV